jgi:hypothetical protein
MRKPMVGRRLVVTIASAALAALVVGGTAAAIDGMTKGSVPAAAFRSDGTMDKSMIPDFVRALDRDGEPAGFVPKSALAIYNGVEDADVIPVYADDLKTIVGHMIAGVGFVPQGADAKAMPTFQVTTGTSPAPAK